MSLEVIPVDHVAQVQMILELLPDDLGFVHLPRDPLVEGRGLVVEIPLDVQLQLLTVLVVEVAVELNVVVGAQLNQLGDAQVPDAHG